VWTGWGGPNLADRIEGESMYFKVRAGLLISGRRPAQASSSERRRGGGEAERGCLVAHHPAADSLHHAAKALLAKAHAGAALSSCMNPTILNP
jgi:hypothetical protein